MHSACRSPLLRRLCLMLALCFVWSFIVAPCAIAAGAAKKAQPLPNKPRLFTSLAARLANTPYESAPRVAPVAALAAGTSTAALSSLPDPIIVPAPVTLLDEAGRLARPITHTEAAAWERELTTGPDAPRSAVLRLWLGEYALAQDQQPEAARRQFRLARQAAHQAASLLGTSGGADPRAAKRLYGLAVYDGAVALYDEGAYADASDAFHRLVWRRTSLPGYDHALAALWYRHAAACAAYHAQRAALGIPEPPRLDPLCGAAALASSLQTLGLPSNRKSVLAACRVTGEGSSLQDVRDAARKLGAVARTVTADNRGLRLLPKPLVAFVEHDHFISVTAADAGGVTYLCSDCGPWPGGEVRLTWAQWHALEPTLYTSVARPGSPADRLVASLGPTAQGAGAVRVSYAGSLPRLHLSARLAVPAGLSRLRGHVVLYNGTGGATCGGKIDTTKCQCYLCCLTDGGGAGGSGAGGGGGSGGGKGKGGGGVHPLSASSGDPVNLATGEEEYTPGPDLTVYNPTGPSVVWGRLYNSLRGGIGHSYETEDFGPGWSQNYNLSVSDPALTATGRVPQGGSGTFNATNYDYPQATGPMGPPQWDVVGPGGNVIASATAPNGWSLATASTPQRYGPPVYALTVTAPSTTIAASGYEIRTLSGGANGAFFSVVSSSTVGGTTLSSAAGVKYLVFTNGSRVSLTPGAVPNSTATSAPTSGASSRVACAVPNGAPYLAEWDYDGPYSAGHFVVTGVDRTKWIFSVANPNTRFANLSLQGSGSFALSQMVDRNGNAINFNYLPEPSGGTYRSGWDLLASVTDGAGSALLTVSRAPSGIAQVQSVTDRYGRSVAYQEASLSQDSGIENGSLTHVSQVVPSGTSNAPDRYAFAYVGLNDDEGNPHPYLHQITTPSPAGPAPSSASISAGQAGTATAAINYDPQSYFVSSLVDANGNSRTYTACTQSGAAASNPTSFTKVTVTNGGQQVYSYVGGYDTNMSGKSVTDGAGNTVSSSVFSDPNDPYRPSSVTDGNGKTTAYMWDQYGHPLTVTPPSNINRAPAVTTKTWNYNNFALGELQQVQEGTKTPTSFTYYEPSGLVKTFSGPTPGIVANSSAVTYSYTYDALGNILTETMPGNNVTSSITTSYNYTTDGNYSQSDAIGQPLTSTDNLGKVTHTHYDARANQTSITDALGNETDTTYNIADQTLTTTDPATGQTGTGRAARSTTYLYPNGPMISAQAYDEGDTPGPIRQMSYAYGPEGETLGVSGSTEPVIYAYDALYRLSTLTDGGGHATHYYYKQQGYLDAVTYPGYAGPMPTYSAASDGYTNVAGADSIRLASYDLDGNSLTRTDGKGVTTTYTHSADPESLLTLTHYAYPSGYAGTQIADVSLSYDGYGRRSGMADGTGSQSYAYDDEDEPLSTVTTYTGLPAETIGYAYWPDGSRQTMTTPAGGFSYTYDADGRMAGLTNPLGEATSWRYADNGWLVWQTLGDGAYSSPTLNAMGQAVYRVSRKGDGTLLAQWANIRYADGAGNITEAIPTIPAAPAAYSGTTDYAYDARNQLTQEQSSRAGGYTQSDTYDGGTGTGPGNPTTFRGMSHAFNADNQDTANTYDGDGSPTSYGGQAMAFDPEARATTFGTTLTAGYTGDGLRAWKQVQYKALQPGQPLKEGQTNGGGTAIRIGLTYFLYDGNEPVCEMDSAGDVTAVNTFGADGLVSRYAGGSSVFYTFDPSGNVCQRLDGGGSVLSSDLYDAFGGRQSTAGGSDVFGFGAQWGDYTDAETNLVLCTHRYYDPANGRWLTRDPFGYDGGVNLYAYVSNSPVNKIDPSGYSALWSIGDPATPDHFDLSLGRGCSGLKGGTAGFWPAPGRGLPIFNGPGVIKIPDDETGTNRIFRNSDPNFEHALCRCIEQSLGQPPPDYAYFGYNCNAWAYDMWNCAKRAVGKSNPVPGWNSPSMPPIGSGTGPLPLQPG